MPGFVSDRMREREGLAVRQYVWLARSWPIRLLLVAWFLSYAGDLAAFTATSVYVYRVGGVAYVGLLGLLKALPGALLVPLVASWSDRVRRERLLAGSVALRALLLGAAAAVMTSAAKAVLVVVLVGLEAAACGLTGVAAAVLVGVRPLSSQHPVQAVRWLKQLRLDMATGFAAKATDDGFALLRQHAGGRDRPGEAARPDRLMAGAGMAERLRQVLAVAVTGRRSASPATRRSCSPPRRTKPADKQSSRSRSRC